MPCTVAGDAPAVPCADRIDAPASKISRGGAVPACVNGGSNVVVHSTS